MVLVTGLDCDAPPPDFSKIIFFSFLCLLNKGVCIFFKRSEGENKTDKNCTRLKDRKEKFRVRKYGTGKQKIKLLQLY